MKIRDCRINHLRNPLGYKLDDITCSWKTEGCEGKKQEMARIMVSFNFDMNELIYDTGYSKNLNSLASRIELKTEPRTRYYWKVAVKSEYGEEAVSDVQWFETAKQNESWRGKWIICDSSQARHPIFERELEINGQIDSARLYICGLGLYEAYINGQRVGNEYLTPYSNCYDKWIQYQTYDISEQLNSTSSIQVMLGDGWWKGRFGFNAKESKGYYGDTWKLLAEIHIVYKDGREEIIGTDESWNVGRGTINFSNIYDGEYRDDTLEAVPLISAVLDNDPPRGEVTARLSTSVTIHEEIKPIKLLNTPAGEKVFDLGQNFAGIFRLHIKEPKGTRIRIQFGEILQNGNFYNKNLRTAKAEYVYVSDGVEKDIVPMFTFYGYRYAKVDGIDNLKTEDFTGLVLYSELIKTGELETGNELVNKLISNTRWGLRSNFIDVPTDCPQRDERMGWTGDAQVFCPTACFLEESFAFYRKYLFDCAQEQFIHNGMVPNVIPSAGHDQQCSSVWGDAVCIIPWTLYQFYGDISILEDQYDSMRSWVQYIRKIDGDNHGWGEHFHYGDWLALDNLAGGPEQVKGATEDGFIASIYYGGSARILADSAKLLGKVEDEKEYRRLSEQIFSVVVDEYYSKNGRCCITTQTGYLLSLFYQLTNNQKVICSLLRKKFQENEYKLQTGFVGTPLLCNILSENGLEDIAYRLLLNEEYPGWLNEIRLGATTVWERWNSVLPDGSISGTGMNSLNHYAYGSITEWMFRYIAGINPSIQQPGFKKAILKPIPNWDLKRAAAEYDSPAGLYKSAWEVIDLMHIRMMFSVPFDCTAELKLYKAVQETFDDKSNPIFEHVQDGICFLVAGDYEVTYKMKEPLQKSLNSYTPANSYTPLKELLQDAKAAQLLAKIMPGVAQAPPDFCDYSPRIITHKYGDPKTVEALDKFDQMMKL